MTGTQEARVGARRPSAWPALAAYAVAFTGTLAAGAVLVGALAGSRARGDAARFAEEVHRFAVSVEGLSGVALLDAVVLAGVALGTARWLPGGVAMLRLGRSRASMRGVLAAVAGTAGLSLACGAGCDLAGVGQGEVMKAIAQALRGASPAGLTVALAALSVAPGLAEELFFRGLMQGRLGVAWGRKAGLVAAAAAFGLMHLDPVQGSVAFALGMYLGAVADRFGSVRPAMAAHAANNALFLVVAHLSEPASGSMGKAHAVAALAAGALLCGGATAALRASWAMGPQASGKSSPPLLGDEGTPPLG